MTDQAMEASHTNSMNLRFIERSVPSPEHGEGISRKVRILQQMMVPKDWNKHDIFWQDVACVGDEPQRDG